MTWPQRSAGVSFRLFGKSYQGSVYEFAAPGKITGRWICPHHHRSRGTAQACADRNINRKLDRLPR